MTSRLFKLFLLPLLVILSPAGLAATIDIIQLDSSTQQVAVGHSAYVLEDPEGIFTPQQVMDLDISNFDKLQEQSLNKGFTHSTYWLRFSLQDNSTDNLTQTWKLETIEVFSYVKKLSGWRNMVSSMK